MNEPTHCPYLGLRQNRAIRFAAPTPEHRCYRNGVPEPIPVDQRGYCLSANHRACPLYTGRWDSSMHPMVLEASGAASNVASNAKTSPVVNVRLFYVATVILCVLTVLVWGVLGYMRILRQGGASEALPIVITATPGPPRNAATATFSPTPLSTMTSVSTSVSSSATAASSAETITPSLEQSATELATEIPTAEPTQPPTIVQPPEPTQAPVIVQPDVPTETPAPTVEILPPPEQPTEAPPPASTAAPTSPPATTASPSEPPATDVTPTEQSGVLPTDVPPTPAITAPIETAAPLPSPTPLPTATTIVEPTEPPLPTVVELSPTVALTAPPPLPTSVPPMDSPTDVAATGTTP